MNGLDLAVFCDTNIAIYLLSGDSELAEMLQGMEVHISELELLSKPNITTDETAATKAFINQCFVVNISEGVKKRTIEIRKRSKIKLPDAIIAASASVCGLPLLTADKQFEKISELNTLLLKR
jgi:predicted nucleic acid-binding protein